MALRISDSCSASPAQVIPYAQYLAIGERIKQLNEQCEVLKRCNLDKEAKRLFPEIEKLNFERLTLLRKIDQERREAARDLLVCFATCDLLTTVADEFADNMHRISRGYVKKDEEFTGMLRQLAQDANDVVVQIDKLNRESTSLLYADMAEECVDAAKAAIREVIERWQKTKQGRKCFT